VVRHRWQACALRCAVLCCAVNLLVASCMQGVGYGALQLSRRCVLCCLLGTLQREQGCHFCSQQGGGCQIWLGLAVAAVPQPGVSFTALRASPTPACLPPCPRTCLPARLPACPPAGDVNSVSIGEKTSVQDNAVVHVARHNVGGQPQPTVIGSSVTIGPGATIHAATIEDCVVVGMGATIMDGAKVSGGLGQGACSKLFRAVCKGWVAVK